MFIVKTAKCRQKVYIGGPVIVRAVVSVLEPAAAASLDALTGLRTPQTGSLQAGYIKY